jgi:hypothetical protein
LGALGTLKRTQTLEILSRKYTKHVLDAVLPPSADSTLSKRSWEKAIMKWRSELAAMSVQLLFSEWDEELDSASP